MGGADEANEALARRALLGRGAAVAGVAAGAVALGVVGARPAAAANGDPVTVGGSFTGSTATRFTTSAGGNAATTPAVQVGNPSGPALRVDLRTSVPDLAVGEVSAFDGVGLVIGYEDEAGDSYTSPVATLDDVYNLPLVVPTSGRLVDTRDASSPNVLRTGGPGFDSQHRLQAGSYMDVRVGSVDDEFVDGVFLNLTATRSVKGGFLFAYSPAISPTPAGSTLNYPAGVSVANGCLVATSVVGSSYAVRIYASSTTHVVVDLTGKVATQLTASTQRKSSGRSAARRITSRKALRRR